MTITFPSNTKEVIDAIRGAIGREVSFYVVSESDCPTCTLDPITKTSTNSFCPTCSGYGYIHTLSGYTISGHVTWGQNEILNWQSAGQLFDGDCRVQIEYTEENYTIADTADFIVVDGKTLEVKKKILRGVPEVNRILLDLKERNK